MTDLRAEHLSDDVRELNPNLFVKRKRPDSVTPGPGSEAEESFAQMFGMVSIEDLEREYMFDHVREWRLDFAHPETRIAVEIDGGVWINGRHVRGQGYIDDTVKLNAATAQGWRVFRFPAHLLSLNDAELVAGAIDQALGERVEDE